MPTSISDLPRVLLATIIQGARGRVIPGTNKYAEVARRWKVDSATDNPGDAEPLRLLLDLCPMSDAELDRACSWMAMHGHHVSTLVLEGNRDPPQRHEEMLASAPALAFFSRLDRVLASAPALTCLRRLEVKQEHSLMLLVPVLGQLPQLQHLAACMTLMPGGASDVMGQPSGVIQDATGVWVQEAPDLQQLCPRLSHLHLMLDAQGVMCVADAQLQRLLPGQLRQLVLRARHTAFFVEVTDSTWCHLTALERMTLCGVLMLRREAGALGQPWVSLQELCAQSFSCCLVNPNIVLQLPSKVIACEDPSGVENMDELTNMVCLRRLAIGLRGGLLGGMADTLAALTGLQQLTLKEAGSSLPAAVQLAAGVPALRGLELHGGRGTPRGLEWDPSELNASLGQCTQLTSLALVHENPLASHAHVHFQCLSSAVQQLTGLRSLTVPSELLQREQGAWLAPLTALTRLSVALRDMRALLMDVFGRPEGAAPAESQAEPSSIRLVQQVLADVWVWPASLQQVVFWVAGADTNPQPMCWLFGPTATSSAQFTVWVEQPSGLAPGWARPFRPCPHLPGVWELQEEEQDSW